MSMARLPADPTRRRARRALRAGAIAALSISLAGCSLSFGPTPTPSPTEVATAPPTATLSPTPVPTPTPEPTPVRVPAPLTGLLVTPEQAARHPIAVMIDDHSAARPQSGFSAASIVWQAPAEGGIPRYMLIFGENEATAVGPVRSARLYFVAWAAEYKAVYAHVGGSPQAMAILAAQGNGKLLYNADEFRWGTGYFWRITTRVAPHNMYTDGAHLHALADRVGATAAPTALWSFGAPLALVKRPVGGRIDVTYSTSSIRYEYDRATNTYLRSVMGKPQTDGATKARVAPTNVVVIVMSFAPLNDGSHKNRLEADYVGSGTAWVSANGTTFKGTWKKASISAPTLLYDAKGKLVTLTAGQTFVNVVPNATDVKVVAGTPAPTPEPENLRIPDGPNANPY